MLPGPLLLLLCSWFSIWIVFIALLLQACPYVTLRVIKLTYLLTYDTFTLYVVHWASGGGQWLVRWDRLVEIMQCDAEYDDE